MRFNGEWKDRTDREQAGMKDGAMEDPELEKVLCDFRTSVRAWSDAVYAAPRLVATNRRRSWRRAAAWALGSVLVVGGASWGGVLEHQHRMKQDRLARLRQQEVDRQVQEQKAREAEEELAKVDSAVSREVPDALAPLVPASDEPQ